MITDNHRKLADLAAHTLHLGNERRAKFLRALAQTYPFLTISSNAGTLDLAKLKRLRKLKGWSQTKLAKKSEMSLRQYQNVETGKTGTTRKRMILIAEALGVSMASIT